MRGSLRARLQTLRWFAPAGVLFTALRAPSFLEPHWYTDEASYVSVARGLLRGKVLYTQIWNNKPPLQSWTVALVVRLFGSSEAALHLLTFVAGGLAVAAVAWAAWHLLTSRRAAVAAIVAAALLGLPILDAELAIPESLLIAPLSWAGAILLVNLDPRSQRPLRRVELWPVAVGALTAAAIAYQQTALAETGAFALAMLLSRRARLRDLAAFLGVVVAITGAWVAVAVLQAGAGHVGFALVGFYVAYTQSVFPATPGGVVAHLAEVMCGSVLLIGGAWLLRRSRSLTWVMVLWAGASLLVAAVSKQPYAHYLTPAVVPLALLVASVPAPTRLRALRSDTFVRSAPQITGLVVAASMASVAGLDWVPFAAPSAQLNTYRNLGMYYGGAVAQMRADWEDSFDARVAADSAVADWLQGEGLNGSTAVVWSSDAWLYALADLDEQMPTPPIYNDEVLLGINGPVADLVDTLSPTLIIVSDDAAVQFPEIKSLLDGSKYLQVYASAPDTVWLRGDVVASLGSLPGQTLR